MPKVTTQPAVRAALQTALAARPGLAGIEMAYGEPGDSGRREAILIGTDLDSTTLEQRVMRVGKNEEDYQLRVHVLAGLQETPAKTEARAELLAEEIQAAVDGSGRPPFGLTEVSWVRVAGTELVTEANADGLMTRLTVLINVRARLG